jgi:hypothetical protein
LDEDVFEKLYLLKGLRAMFDGGYPPGVTGEMIDDYFRDNERCCETCREYDGDRCMKEWNDLDPAYYVPGRDDKDPTDYCDDWKEN